MRRPVRSEEMLGLWREGQRRLAEAEPTERVALERAIEAVVIELRRRLGGPFTVRELVDFYVDQGADWCFQIALGAAPATPAAWDVTTVAGAAFTRYAREAIDFRRASPEEEP